MQQPLLPWYKQFWPWFLIALPGVVIIASVITIVIAARQPDSLVVDDYYKKGLAINRELAADETAARLQLKATASITATPPTLQLVLTGELATQPTQLQLQILHPVKASQDIKLQLARDKDGQYRGNWPVQHFTAPARWKLILQDSGQHWRMVRTVSLPSQNNFVFSAATQIQTGETHE